MTRHTNPIGPYLPSGGSSGSAGVTLRSAAELADALPFLVGFHPSDSIVLACLHGRRRRFGGRLRLGIPADPEEWAAAASELAECLVRESEHGAGRPDAVVLFLCQDPGPDESPSGIMERLRPLAQALRLACGAVDVPVVEALCLSGGRWFSYCCPTAACCPPDGTGITPSGGSVMAAAAAYAGIRVRGSLRDMRARLTAPAGPDVRAQRQALDEACADLLPKILDSAACERVRELTLSLVETSLERFRAAVPRRDGPDADEADDALLADAEAARIVLGLQDRTTRDHAAEWMEPQHSDAALRLWRALARRCVAPYQEYAAAPLTLAGWVAWSSGDDVAAEVAFDRALALAPDYAFARLLSAALGGGLDPEPIRRCLRKERNRRTGEQAAASRGPTGTAGPAPVRRSPGGRRARTRR